MVQEGKKLAFVVFPAAIAKMPASSVFSVLFFLMLLLLGVASAYGMLEVGSYLCLLARSLAHSSFLSPVLQAFSTVLYDRFPLLSRNKRLTTASLSVIGFCVGLCMCTRSGQFILDILDHFLSDHLLIVSGYLECIVIGWIYGIEKFSNDVYKATGNRKRSSMGDEEGDGWMDRWMDGRTGELSSMMSCFALFSFSGRAILAVSV